MVELDFTPRKARKGEARQFCEALSKATSEELGNECLIWPFGIAGNGYGALHIGKTQ